MGDKTGIEWTDATWNVIYGCSRVSPGCENCYAETFTHRFSGQKGHRMEGLTVLRKSGPSWTGKITLAPDRLDQPLRWQRPRMIFVNSLSDVFHKDVPFEFVAAMFGVMGLAQDHTFQILTKRHERMVEFYEWMVTASAKRNMTPFQFCLRVMEKKAPDITIPGELYQGHVALNWPLDNVWMGVSVEDQERCEERIPYLQQVPAAVRFLSMEPMVGEVNDLDLAGIHWVILGGESGPGSRPMNPEWVRYVRDRCDEEGVPFFMKQWGQHDADGIKAKSKKDNGCALDGIDHKEWPVTTP
jgi:protein gp37